MSDQITLDDKLAELTDSLLAEGEAIFPQELKSEEYIVQQLNRIILPKDSLNPAFRERLTRRLNEEWERTFQRRSRRRIVSFPLRSMRGLAVAASIALVFAFIILTVLGDGSGDGSEQLGFAQGPLTGFIILIVLGIISALAFYGWGRRK